MNLIIITGQTATGKTKLALEYAKKYDGELVNFDSRQVYQYLDIITGKDLPAKTGNGSGLVWLYDVVKPDQYYSSFEYVKDVQIVIKDIINRGKTPILVGGSYFYLKHLLYGFDYKVPPDFKLRKELNKKSVEQLQDILNKIDDKSLNQMNNSDRNNPRRLIRRIEIEKCNSSTKIPSLSSLRKQGSRLKMNMIDRIPAYAGMTKGEKNFSQIFIGLRYMDKEKLRLAIKLRVEKRLKQGAIKEVKRLLTMGYKKTDPGLKTIGYKQIVEYLEGVTNESQAVENWITAEVQYAKRQYTFMKKDNNILWKEI
ncbi:tRNA (adenosine(37)-N6)-dimethylallyltransferase MiaA [Patescibacteria group bacterium]|nr:tRNA (adenosine(37)-N6)-dimethylallyltransferase MiaA [Patescibacteria group bacterium]